MFAKPTAVINLEYLKDNARLARAQAPDSKLLAVVKANAYGHGVHQVVKALRDEALADGFAVARFEEALELRQTQKDIPVLVLGGVYTNNELDSCLQHNINVVVHQQEQVELLCNHLTNRNTQINIWLKMDTGMHRLGIPPEQFLSSYQKLRPLPFIKKLGALTHFANAEQAGNAHTQKQLDTFFETIKTLPKDWPVNISLANSAAVLRWPQSHGDWNRPGLMLYGINPLPDKALDLKPVMSLRSPIVSVRTVNQGEYVGYSMRWQAKRPSLIATVALGYGDGYPTQIKSGTPVLIDGQRAPIVGRVSMDLITVDCTDLASVRTGDMATFWGEDEQGNRLSTEEVAEYAGTIPYDLVSKIGGRVKYNFQ
jgi:alanine racemase